jgi:hypothetical protein
MILTERAKEDFLKQFNGEVPVNEIELYAYIVDWFDSKGFFVTIKNKFGHRKQCQRFSYFINNVNSGFVFNSRIEATKGVIQKANYYYNKKHNDIFKN